MKRFPVGMISTIDPVLRASAGASLALSGARIAVIQHDVDALGVRRIVTDRSGTIEDHLTELEHSCLTCAVREDAIPTLARLAASGAWDAAILALPLGADSAPVAATLHRQIHAQPELRSLVVAGIAAVVDGPSIDRDAFSTDYLEDRLGRDSEFAWGDDRVVAEALAPQLAHADLVVVNDVADDAGRATLEHLTGGATPMISGIGALNEQRLLSLRFSPTRSAHRVDPLRVRHHGRPDRAGVWTIELTSDRPLHPGRLRSNLRALADHPVVARGHFWIPARPHEACAWDGAGGQLSVGSCGRWHTRQRSTRIVVTGADSSRDTIQAAFANTLLLPGEHDDPMCSIDTLADWLDPRDLELD